MINFGLMFFAASEDAEPGNRYRLVVESARFADRNRLSSIWVPERHFTKFGSLYPNPAVLHSALALATERIRLNAGSVVVPLHNPIRIAEEWAMVDNLSGGRVGVSFAPGWNPADFAFFPERYETRQRDMLEGIRAVQKLWRGETLTTLSGDGEQVDIRIYPSPIQPELPIWLTAAGNPKTYMLAGTLGANLLTHLLDQDEQQLADKIALYRKARADHGWDPDAGIVTVMLHAFVGTDADAVREQARTPYCQYLKGNIGLLKGLSQSRGQNVDVSSMPERELDEFVNFLYERFATERGLIGTPESCFPLVERLHGIGVNEIACLLDFGPDVDLILSNLTHLNRLKDLCNRRFATVGRSDSRQRKENEFIVESIQSRCSTELSGAEFNDQLRSYGIEIEGGFNAVERIWRRDGEALGRIRLPVESLNAEDKFTIHPAFLDACSRVLALALPEVKQAEVYLPAGIRSLRVLGPVPVEGWSHATINLREQNDDRQKFEGDVDIYDFEGRMAVSIEGLRLERAVLGNETMEGHAARTYDLAYKRNWIESPLNGQTESIEGDWLILADRRGVGENLAALIREAGAGCVLVSTADCDSTSVDAMSKIVAQTSPHRIVHLWSLDSTASTETTLDSLQRDQELICASALHLIQAASSEPFSATKRLYFVTKGAVALHDGEAVAYTQAPLWGLARAMSVEHPKLWGGIVDLDHESSAAEAAGQLFKFLREPDGEDMVAFRAGQRYVARIQRDESIMSVPAPFQIDKGATYLIVGGLGGLGLATARWLSKLGARNLALVSRSGPDAEATRAIQALEKSGVSIRVYRADVSRAEDMALAMASIKSTMPPLKGVLHLAGVLDDAMLSDQNWERFHAVGLAKVEGAWVLHKLTEEDALDFFVLFSSMAALVTMPGQGNYAAANCFLDALANYRRSIGLTALTVNWGPWGEIGHAATEYGRNAHRQLAQLGIDAISPRQGLELLDTLLGQQQTQVCIAQVNWSKLFQNHPAAADSPLLREQVRHAALPAATIEDTEFVKVIRALPEDERRDALSSFLSDLIAKALKLNDGERLAPQQGLFALGLDSILALQLKSQLEISLGRSFRATLFFTHPNIASLSEHLLSELEFGSSASAPKTATLEFQEAGTESIDQTMPLDTLSEEEIANLIVREIGYGKEISGTGSRRMEEPAGG